MFHLHSINTVANVLSLLLLLRRKTLKPARNNMRLSRQKTRSFRFICSSKVRYEYSLECKTCVSDKHIGLIPSSRRRRVDKMSSRLSRRERLLMADSTSSLRSIASSCLSASHIPNTSDRKMRYD